LRHSTAAGGGRAKHPDTVTRLLRTAFLGFILGIAGSAALAYFVPVVDLHRERSLVSVQPNGGNLETFRIDLPRDRILVGLAGAEASMPAGLEWPVDPALGNFQAEIFKVRDSNNVVIGVASRLASSTDASGSFIEWALHFPARGTLYARMEMSPTDQGYRNGTVRAGTRDFEHLAGSVREHYIAKVEEQDHDIKSRIELVTALVSSHVDTDEGLVDVVADTTGDKW
jgi:hypothetical protein